MTQSHRANEIEKAVHGKDVNVAQIVRHYKESVLDKPLLHLIQDINQRVGIYSNLLEDLKRMPGPTDDNTQATELRNRYEKLGLIPGGNIPNPTAESIIQYVLEKIASFGRALLVGRFN